jgi:hypothetical protein
MVHDTVADESPGTAMTPVGAAGTPTGVTDVEGADSALFPTLFVAWTVNVYMVPFLRPVTWTEVAPVVVAVMLSGVEVTV